MEGQVHLRSSERRPILPQKNKRREKFILHRGGELIELGFEPGMEVHAPSHDKVCHIKHNASKGIRFTESRDCPCWGICILGNVGGNVGTIHHVSLIMPVTFRASAAPVQMQWLAKNLIERYSNRWDWRPTICANHV